MPDEIRPEDAQPAQPDGVAPEQVEPTAIVDVPDDLSVVGEEQLRELYASIEAQVNERAAEARTPADLEAISQLRGLAQRIHGEVTRRRTEEAQVAEGLAEFQNSPLEPLPDGAPTTPAATEQPAEPELVGAGATAANLAAARVTGEVTPPLANPNRPTAALLAAAGAEIVPSGTPIDFAGIGTSFDRIKRQAGGDAILASIPAYEETPEQFPALLSTDNGVPANTALMREAQADWRARQAGETPAARQSAICEPFDILRDIPDAFVTAEPVRSIFPSRPMGRMGWQFLPSIGLADVADGVGMWYEADQDAVTDTESTWKPCVEVDCPDIETVAAEAVTACLTFDITTEMSNPERVRNFTNATMALMARIKEGRILERIDQLSHGYRYTGDYGALPAVIEAVNTVLAQLTFVNRTSPGSYVLIVPPAVREVLTIDRANKAYGEEQDASTDVMTYLRSNINVAEVVDSLDASLGSEPGIPFAGLPPVGNQGANMGAPPYISGGVRRLRLVAPEDAIYAETGQINVGVTRDSQLIRQNKSQFFAEEFFALAKNGPSPWATIDIDLCADGGRGGLYDPHGCLIS